MTSPGTAKRFEALSNNDSSIGDGMDFILPCSGVILICASTGSSPDSGYLEIRSFISFIPALMKSRDFLLSWAGRKRLLCTSFTLRCENCLRIRYGPNPSTARASLRCWVSIIFLIISANS